MRQLILASLIMLGCSLPAVASTGWQTASKAYKPIYWGVNGVCFLVNFPVSSVMWVNKHVKTTLDNNAKEEAAENAVKQ